MKRRTLGLACLLLAMLVGMTAWVSAQEPVTLIWSFWGDPNELPPNYQVIEAFEAAYPYIKIETQHAPWSSYFDRIQTQMAGGTAPDVMFLNNIPKLCGSRNLDAVGRSDREEWIRY